MNLTLKEIMNKFQKKKKFIRKLEYLLKGKKIIKITIFWAFSEEKNVILWRWITDRRKKIVLNKRKAIRAWN